jgi:hypothetical protein
MGFASKNNDCQKQSCAIPPYWLYAQNGSTPDETHAFRRDCRYGAQSPARLPHAGGRRDPTKREIFDALKYGICRMLDDIIRELRVCRAI